MATTRLDAKTVELLTDDIATLLADVAWQDGEHADACDRITTLLAEAGDDEEALRLALQDAQELLSTLAQEWGAWREQAVELYERIDEALGTA